MPTSARSIGFAVGRDARNRRADVKTIQRLINGALAGNDKFRSSGVTRLEDDGDCGPLTIEAIRRFQSFVLGWSGPAVDGRVDPNGTTWKALNGNVRSNRQIRTAVEPRPTQISGFAAFKQGDFRSVKLGEGTLNIAGHGCALCTLTMAATVIGSPTASWTGICERPALLTPPLANRIIAAAGGFRGSLLIMKSAAEALGMRYEEYGRDKDVAPAEARLIDSNLMLGWPVAAHVDYKSSSIGDHWILVVARNGGSIFDAVDPATGRRVQLTNAPQSRGSFDVTRTVNIQRGVLFGWGQGGSKNQQKYVVVRFALLSPA